QHRVSRLGALQPGDDVLDRSAVAVFVTRETGLNAGIVTGVLEFFDQAAANNLILLAAAGMRNSISDETLQNLAGSLS
ncbi:MAG: hypothetical protein WA823_15935, partial [Candidatus Acidiferrales bacterium]